MYLLTDGAANARLTIDRPMHSSSHKDRGRGFVRGSISLARVTRKCLNERPGICGLLGLGDSNLYGGTAEVTGSVRLCPLYDPQR